MNDDRQLEILREVSLGTWKPTMELPRDSWGTILFPDPATHKMSDEERENYIGQLQIQSNADIAKASYHELKAANTTELLRLNREAIVKEYNRALSDEAENDLDPEGVHIVRAFMLHRHAAGAPVKPHYRCFLYLKTKFSSVEKPVEATMDIGIEDFNRLIDVHRIVPVVHEGSRRHLRFDFDFIEVMRKLNKAA